MSDQVTSIIDPLTVVAGGDLARLLDLVRGLASDVDILTDPALETELDIQPQFLDHSRLSVVRSVGLRQDLAVATRRRRPELLVVSGSVLQATLVSDRHRLAEQTSFLAGYPIAADQIDTVVQRRLARDLTAAASDIGVPVVVHDPARTFAAIANDTVSRLDLGRALAEPSAPVFAARPPTIDQVRAHALFLTTTEPATLRDMHAFLTDPDDRAIVTTWRQALDQLPDSDAVLRDGARARLDEVTSPSHQSAAVGLNPSATPITPEAQEAAVTRAVLEALAAAELSAEERIQSAVDEALARERSRLAPALDEAIATAIAQRETDHAAALARRDDEHAAALTKAIAEARDAGRADAIASMPTPADAIAAAVAAAVATVRAEAAAEAEQTLSAARIEWVTAAEEAQRRADAVAMTARADAVGDAVTAAKAEAAQTAERAITDAVAGERERLERLHAEHIASLTDAHAAVLRDTSAAQATAIEHAVAAALDAATTRHAAALTDALIEARSTIDSQITDAVARAVAEARASWDAEKTALIETTRREVFAEAAARAAAEAKAREADADRQREAFVTELAQRHLPPLFGPASIAPRSDRAVAGALKALPPRGGVS